MTRRLIASSLAAILTLGISPLLLAQTGTISGKADDEAKQPYTDYSVQLVEVIQGGQNTIVGTSAIDPQGGFAFTGVAGDKRYLVQLLNVKTNTVVCTEGPYDLISPNQLSKTDVDIDCDKVPALWWVLAGGAGIITGVALANQSGSQ